jgi:hypothetical protein
MLEGWVVGEAVCQSASAGTYKLSLVDAAPTTREAAESRARKYLVGNPHGVYYLVHLAAKVQSLEPRTKTTELP